MPDSTTSALSTTSSFLDEEEDSDGNGLHDQYVYDSDESDNAGLSHRNHRHASDQTRDH
jgi:hypothetical protein